MVWFVWFPDVIIRLVAGMASTLPAKVTASVVQVTIVFTEEFLDDRDSDIGNFLRKIGCRSCFYG